MQDKLDALSQIDLLASSNPGAAADPAHIDLFADTIIALSGKPSDGFIRRDLCLQDIVNRRTC